MTEDLKVNVMTWSIYIKINLLVGEGRWAIANLLARKESNVFKIGICGFKSNPEVGLL